MARRNTETKNSPYKIDAVNYTTADALSDTTGQGGSPRNNTSIWEKLNSLCFDVEWTIGTEGGDAINVTAQLLDLKGRNLCRYASGMFSLHSSDAAGASYGAIDTATEGLTLTTGEWMHEELTDSLALVQTNSDGKLVFSISETTGPDQFKCIIHVGDRVFLSPLIEFA